MAEETTTGTIVWHDLTVADAEGVRDFYEAVAGWRSEPIAMGDYSDYAVGPAHPEGSEEVGIQGIAGVCHARGANVGLPAQWLMYIQVADLDASIAACTEKGGSVISGPRAMGPGSGFCVIRDPAGAVCALMGPTAAAG